MINLSLDFLNKMEEEVKGKSGLRGDDLMGGGGLCLLMMSLDFF
jgi:hypothetical protein